MGLAVALISPFDIWSAGFEHLARSRGWSFVGRLSCDPADVQPDTVATCGVDVLLVAKGLMAQCDGIYRKEPSATAARCGTIIVIEPFEPFTMQDFLTFDVEGLVLSSGTFDELGNCVESVADGGRWIDPGLRELLGQGAHDGVPSALLSDRELQVARLAAVGRSNKQIARDLSVSDGTVKMHMHHILGKLGLASRFNLRELDWLKIIPSFSNEEENHHPDIVNNIPSWSE